MTIRKLLIPVSPSEELGASVYAVAEIDDDTLAELLAARDRFARWHADCPSLVSIAFDRFVRFYLDGGEETDTPIDLGELGVDDDALCDNEHAWLAPNAKLPSDSAPTEVDRLHVDAEWFWWDAWYGSSGVTLETHALPWSVLEALAPAAKAV